MSENEQVLLGILGLDEAKRIRARLEERGVEVELRSNPETCSTQGCRITLEVHAQKGDLTEIQKFFQEEKQRSLEGLQVDPELESVVFDPEQETARCPACGTSFSTTYNECPECGLVFFSE